MKTKVVFLVLCLMFVMGSCWAMTSTDIQEAIRIGYIAADDKKDFVYNQKDSDRIYAGLDMQYRADAFLMFPQSTVATYALKTKKNYMKLDDTKAAQYSNLYTLGVTYTIQFKDKIQQVVNPRVVALQDDKVIEPCELIYGDVQVNHDMWGKALYGYGVTARFNANDIDTNKALTIKVISTSSRELTFRYDLSNSNNAYKSTRNDYKFKEG